MKPSQSWGMVIKELGRPLNYVTIKDLQIEKACVFIPEDVFKQYKHEDCLKRS